jgi:hypothetical protein
MKDAGVNDNAPGVIKRTFERWSADAPEGAGAAAAGLAPALDLGLELLRSVAPIT